MMKKTITTLAILLLSVSTLAVAAPFSVTWTDTIGAGSEAPYIVGQSLSVTYVLDNGGASTVSQTWNPADVVSVTFVLNNGAITTVFDPNGGGGFDSTLGNFATNGAGALTSVPVDWADSGSAVSSNDPQGTSLFTWYVNGFNSVYYNNTTAPDDRSAGATNVTNNINPAFWSFSGAPPPPPPPPSTATPIPAMSIYALVLTTLGLLLVATRRLRS